MTQNYTSLEQSKKLLAVGLRPDTADLVYQGFKDEISGGEITYTLDFVCNWESAYPDRSLFEDENDDTFVPCWSLGSLRKLIPVGINLDGDTYLFKNHNRIDGSWVYYFAGENDATLVHCTGTDFNACFELVVWLIEKGYIDS